MKIILTTNIKKLGKVGDQVMVKDGFARNYLFPNKMALRDNKSNLEHFGKIKEDINLKENQKKEESIKLIEAAKEIDIIFIKEADDKDQLYGAVSKKEILNFLEKKDIKVLSDDIKLLSNIRTLGEHVIELNPYEGISTQLKVIVKKT